MEPRAGPDSGHGPPGLKVMAAATVAPAGRPHRGWDSACGDRALGADARRLHAHRMANCSDQRPIVVSYAVRGSALVHVSDGFAGTRVWMQLRPLRRPGDKRGRGRKGATIWLMLLNPTVMGVSRQSCIVSRRNCFPNCGPFDCRSIDSSGRASSETFGTTQIERVVVKAAPGSDRSRRSDS